jgi:hypothetical protein
MHAKPHPKSEVDDEPSPHIKNGKEAAEANLSPSLPSHFLVIRVDNCNFGCCGCVDKATV